MILIPVALVLLAFVAYDLARPKQRVEAPASPGPIGWGVVRAFGRFEGRELVRHPIFLAGVGLTLLAVLMVGWGAVPILSRDDATFPLFVFPMAGLTLIATNLAALRGRRDQTEELYASLPAGHETRTAGHVFSVSWASVVAIAVVAGFVIFSRAIGGFGTPNAGELLAAAALVACAGAVGVTAARLIPSAVVGPIAVVLMGFFKGTVDTFAGEATSRPTWFSPWVPEPDVFPQGLWVRRPWSHLVYLLGLGAFAAVLGLLRHRIDKRTVGALIVSLGVIAGGGLVQSRAVSAAEYDGMAAWIERGATTCQSHDGVRYCVYPELRPFLSEWLPSVRGALEQAPAAVRSRSLAVVQRPSPFSLYKVPGGLGVRLAATTPTAPPAVWPVDGAIHPGTGWCLVGGTCDLSLGVQTGAWAVGLPLDPLAARPNVEDPYASPFFDTYDASGEARAVVALWLGARSTPGARAQFLKRTAAAPDDERGPDEPGPGDAFTVLGCEGIGESGTAFGALEASYTVQLLQRPDDEVGSTIRAHWDRLTNPRTSSAVVARIFGLDEPDSTIYFNNC